jgi:hypothetical protein
MSESADDELFGEAAAEIRTDVEEHIEAAWAELPEADDVWEVEADNVLGVLNGLKSALDAGDAADHYRDARKWYTMGERADAFEDAADLEEQLDELGDIIEDLEAAADDVGTLTGTIPGLRSALQDAESEG